MKLLHSLFVAVAISAISNSTSADSGLILTTGGHTIQVATETEEDRKNLPLCARHLNFWCIKKPGNVRWDGQIDEDSKNHAIFSDASFSARAFFRLMWTYRFKHNLKTADEIFGRYAPASDCIGSVGRDRRTGRCPRGENLTWVYSRKVAQSLDLKPDEDIRLFTSQDTVDRQVAIKFAQAIASFELGRGYSVSKGLVDSGVALAGFSYP
ncbi:hypothetical protein [Jannaschia sp. M317]|uniref:hypothetical protein n=1 Tax=Jannaschia sp. M317 TaxID=2867011 RepID=UPI0021A5E568|nr:hypothetical protein [Jannaschia sp. M317]UWQ19223.1 hypothetical protein K3551_08135 [Jannaschia sp. M317]